MTKDQLHTYNNSINYTEGQSIVKAERFEAIFIAIAKGEVTSPDQVDNFVEQ